MRSPRLFPALLLATAAALTLQPSPAEATTQTYWFACRGGGNFTTTFSVQNVQFEFARGAKGYNGNVAALAPGTCAWRDRGLASNEPRVLMSPLIQPNKSDSEALARMTDHAVACTTNPNCAFETTVYRDGSVLRAEFHQLGTLRLVMIP